MTPWRGWRAGCVQRYSFAGDHAGPARFHLARGIRAYIRSDMISLVFGKLIRDARIDAGLSQAELAARSGTSQEALSAYERGRKDPSASTATRILAAAGWTVVRAPAREVWTAGAAELERRARILAQVVDLAERLPAKRRGHLAYPPLHAQQADE